MLAETPARMSLEEFLQWEQLQDEKHELIDGVPVARRLRKFPPGPVMLDDGTTMMAGGAVKHHRIALNIIFHLQERLSGGPCETFGSDLLVRITDAKARYPDAYVRCGEELDPDALEVRDPVVVFEVLSPSNRFKERLELLDDYALLPSVRQIVLVDARRPFLMNSLRTDAIWRREELVGEEATLLLPSLNTELPFSEIYERVKFAA